MCVHATSPQALVIGGGGGSKGGAGGDAKGDVFGAEDVASLLLDESDAAAVAAAKVCACGTAAWVQGMICLRVWWMGRVSFSAHMWCCNGTGNLMILGDVAYVA